MILIRTSLCAGEFVVSGHVKKLCFKQDDGRLQNGTLVDLSKNDMTYSTGTNFDDRTCECFGATLVLAA